MYCRHDPPNFCQTITLFTLLACCSATLIINRSRHDQSCLMVCYKTVQIHEKTSSFFSVQLFFNPDDQFIEFFLYRSFSCANHFEDNCDAHFLYLKNLIHESYYHNFSLSMIFRFHKSFSLFFDSLKDFIDISLINSYALIHRFTTKNFI